MCVRGVIGWEWGSFPYESNPIVKRGENGGGGWGGSIAYPESVFIHLLNLTGNFTCCQYFLVSNYL